MGYASCLIHSYMLVNDFFVYCRYFSCVFLVFVNVSMSEGEVFHEKQRLELCAIHALNNVLQERVFTKETADDICKRYGKVIT